MQKVREDILDEVEADPCSRTGKMFWEMCFGFVSFVQGRIGWWWGMGDMKPVVDVGRSLASDGTEWGEPCSFHPHLSVTRAITSSVSAPSSPFPFSTQFTWSHHESEGCKDQEQELHG